MAGPITNPILNTPYEAPTRYFEIGRGGPTGAVLDGRRPSESYIPIPRTRKGRNDGVVQDSLDFDVTGERRAP
jgi:type III restriction enzyme